MTDIEQLRLLVLDTACRLRALRTVAGKGEDGFAISAPVGTEMDRILTTLDRYKALWLPIDKTAAAAALLADIERRHALGEIE